MTKWEVYEIIEKYIENRLGEDELELFTTKYKEDEEFKREVDLHVKMQTHLLDKEKKDLISNLSSIRKEYSNNTGSYDIRWMKIISVAAASAILLLSVWFFGFKDSSKPDSQEKHQVQIDSPMSRSEDMASEIRTEDKVQPIDENDLTKQKEGFVQEGRKYSENNYFENLIETTNSDSFNFIIKSFENKLESKPTEKPRIHIAGNLESTANISDHDLAISIFNNSAKNRNQSNSLISDSFKIKQDEDSEIQGFVKTQVYDFDFEVRDELPQGLYYYTIVDKTQGKVLFTGKLRIE